MNRSALRRWTWLLAAVPLLARLTADATTAPVAPQAQPTFRSGVELVEVAVLVRDAEGRLVRDLTRTEFTIIDAGVPQTIAAFERVSMPAAAVNPIARDTTAASDVASNERVPDSRVFVIVLDALHVAATRTRVVRAQAARFLEQHVGPSDLAAVVSPGGLASATQDFTRDRSRLFAAINQFTSHTLRSATVERDAEARAGTGGGVVVHNGMDPSDGERAGRAQALTATLEALGGHLGRIEHRRKTLLLFSEGLDYDVTDVMGITQRQASDVMIAMGRAVGALMRANVSMYTIDPRGLSSADGDLLETPLYRERPDISSQSVEAEYSQSIRGLRYLADSTGGFAAVDRNDIGPAFERIDEESREYYVLAYTPAKPPPPGEFRAIGVRVSRPGVQVTARKGYIVRTERRVGPSLPQPAEPVLPGFAPGLASGRGRPLRVEPAPEMPVARTAGLDSELGALLASPLPRAGLPIRVQAVPFKGSNARGTVQLIVEIMGQALQLTERRGRFEERLDLALLTVDDRGRGSNGQSTIIDLRLTPEEAGRVRTTGVRWLARLELPPGRHQVRVAGRAQRTGATGLVASDIDVPAFEPDRLAMSGVTLTSLPSVLLITRGSGWLESTLGTPPSAARRFVAGDRLTAGIEIYVPASVTGDIDAATFIQWPDGSASSRVARRLSRPAAAARAAGASGSTDAVGFPIDTTPLAPGRYVLHIVLSAAGSPNRVEHRVPFDIVGAPAK